MGSHVLLYPAFPCLPLAAEIATSNGGTGTIIHNSTASGTTHTLDVGPILTLSALVAILSVALIVSLCLHCCCRRKVLVVAPGAEEEEPEIVVSPVEDMSTPLLNAEQQDNGDSAELQEA